MQTLLRNLRFQTCTRTSVRGFTLVELLVASSIFSSVLIIAVGALFSAQAINTKIQETQIILDGVNLATEVMGRDMRYGTDFHCESQPILATSSRRSCAFPDGATALVFRPGSPLVGSTDATQDRVMYHIDEATINGQTIGVIYKEEFPFGAPSRRYQITPTDVNIQTLVFYVSGANSTTGAIDVLSVSDLDQPIITFTIAGITIPTKPTRDPVKFNLQASAVPRGIDN